MAVPEHRCICGKVCKSRKVVMVVRDRDIHRCTRCGVHHVVPEEDATT